MVFSSTLFLFRFLPIFMILYFAAPGRMKNIILLLGSLFFYAWGEPVYVVLILISTISDYLHGLVIAGSKRRGVKRLLLTTSLLINLGILGFLQYADFIIMNVNRLFGADLKLLELPLPIGISFYTLQTMSYTIDCYKGRVKAQRNLLDFAVYVTMFPKLPAGPIVRYSEVESQLRERKGDIVQISYGCKRFIIGLAKVVLLANNLGLLWQEVSAKDYGSLTVLLAWLGIVAFAFQIYFGFSGYSDMAIGLGAVLGFTFPENFNYPYISVTLTDFWRRWHISLSSWFKEYVYIPLGGNRKGLLVQLLNPLLLWILTSAWYGAGWNFLLWGMWFALWLMIEKLGLRKLMKRLPKSIGRTYTLLVVLIGWVFFAVGSIEGIVDYLLAMFGQNGAGIYNREGLFLGLENVVLFAIAALAATPLGKEIAVKLGKSATGHGIATYRVLEKLISAMLLIMSIAYVVKG